MPAIMTEPKTFASLKPTLLARKGSAKPAMRPQLTPIDQFGQAAPAPRADAEHDDLGWNDMGHDVAGHDDAVDDSADESGGHDAEETAVVQLQPDPAPLLKPHAAPAADPVVVHQQRNLARQIAEPADRKSALAGGRRAAFTLRVDADRHLKLRLACTLKGRSAQQLVTEALDSLLDDLPDLADLARRVGQSKR